MCGEQLKTKFARKLEHFGVKARYLAAGARPTAPRLLRSFDTRVCLHSADDTVVAATGQRHKAGARCMELLTARRSACVYILSRQGSSCARIGGESTRQPRATYARGALDHRGRAIIGR